MRPGRRFSPAIAALLLVGAALSACDAAEKVTGPDPDETADALADAFVAGDFGEPHTNGACDHEGQCILLEVWADVGRHMRGLLDSFTLAQMVEAARGNATVPATP